MYFKLLIISIFIFLQGCGSEIDVSRFGDDSTKLEVRVEQQESQNDPTQSNNIYFNVFFSSPIEATSFNAGDIIQDGSSTGIVWDVVHIAENKHYFLIGTGPMTAGTLKPRIPAGKIKNTKGVKNLASTSIDNEVLFNGTFEVSINQSTNEVIGTCTFNAQADPATSAPVEFKVVFENSIDTGSFVPEDIVQNGNAVVDTWNITNCGDDQTFKLEAIDISAIGTVRPSLVAGSVLDTSAMGNSESTSVDNEVDYLPSNYIWTGAVDSNWSTAGNWQNNSVPGTNDIAIFSEAYCAGCMVDIDTNIDVDGVLIGVNFTGALTQVSGNLIQVRNTGWIQHGGSFVGGNSNKIIFKDLFIGPSAVYNASSGTIIFDSTQNTNINIGTAILNNVNIIKDHGGTTNRGDLSITGEMNIDGDLNLANTSRYARILSGVFRVAGDISASVWAGGLGTAYNLILDGNSTQNISTIGSDATLDTLNIESSGTVIFGSELRLYRDLIYTSGTIVTTGSTVIFDGYATANISSGNIQFNNVQMIKDHGGTSNLGNLTIIGSIDINGNLLIAHTSPNASLLAGTINLAGNLNIDNNGTGSNSSPVEIIFDGTVDQFINTTTTRIPKGTITVSKGSGVLSQQSHLNLDGTGQDLIIQNGTWNMAGYTLTVNDQLNIGDGVGGAGTAILNEGCVSATAGTKTVNPTDGVLISSSGTPTIDISDASVIEGGNLEFVVTLSEPVCGSATNITFTTDDAMASLADSDYTDNDSTLVIAAGDVTGTITVSTTDDANFELDEALNVNLTGTDQGSIGSSNAKGIIQNDDTSNFTWTGMGADDNWTTIGNWAGGVVPGVNDIAVFDGTCTNCNSTYNIATTIGGIWLKSDYSGTLSQASSNSIMFTTDAYFVIEGGAFSTSTDLIDAHHFKMTGGTLNLANGLLDVKQSFEYISGVVNNTGSVVRFRSQSGRSDVSINSGSFRFDDVEFKLLAGFNARLTGTMIVDGDILLHSENSTRLHGGTIDVSGDAEVVRFDGGNTLIRLVGSGTQELKGASSQDFPSIEVASTGTVNLVGIIVLDGDLSYTSGIVNAGASTVVLQSVYSTTPRLYHQIDYYNLNISLVAGRDIDLAGEAVTITNDLRLNSVNNNRINNGILNVMGDLYPMNMDGGSARVRVAGNSNQTIYGANQGIFPNLEIASSGIVNFEGVINFSGDFDYTNGIVNVGTSTLKASEGGVDSNLNTGALRLNNLNLNKKFTREVNIIGTVLVDGDLAINNENGSSISGGRMEVLGNLIGSNSNDGGSATVAFVGANTQEISYVGNPRFPNLEVNKTGGEVKLLNNYNHSVGGADLNIINGTFNMNGHTLNVADQLNIGDGVGGAGTAILNEGCVSATAGTKTVNPTDGVLISSSGTPTIDISDASVVEGGNLEFVVTLSEPVCGSATNITFTTNNGTATTSNSDYTDNDSTLVISAGNTSGAITVVTTDDTNMESDETIRVSLTGTDQGVLGVTDATGTILNDDDNGYIWTGDAGDNNWETNGNWSGGAAPVADGSVDVLFDNTCNDVPANCDVNINSNIDIRGLWVETDYPGTITQNNGNTINVGHNDFIFRGGTFVGGDSNITTSGFSIFGGNFTSTSGDFRINAGVNGSYDVSIAESATFNHNSGKLELRSGCGSERVNSWSSYNHVLNDVDITRTCSGGLYVNGTMFTAGTVSFGAQTSSSTGSFLSSGIIDVKGNLEIHNVSSSDVLGLLRLTGNSPQTVTFFGQDDSSAPIEIDSTSTVSFIGDVFVRAAPNSNRGFVVNNGTVDMSGANSVRFSTFCCGSPGFRINAPGVTFPSLSLTGLNMDFELESDLIVSGSFTAAAGGPGAGNVGSVTRNIFVGGDVNFTGNGQGGNYNLILNGTGDQLFTYADTSNGTRRDPASIIVNKTSGEVIQQNDLVLQSPSDDLVMTSGIWKMNGHILTVPDALTMAAGTTINKDCNTLTVNGSSIPVGLYDSGTIIGSGSNPIISIADGSITEGGNLEFNVTLSEGVCGSATNITYTTNDGTATLADSDYTDNDSTLIISAGSQQATISVITNNDTKVESNETLNLNLTGTDQGSIGDGLAVGTIQNDDLCPTGFVAVDGNSTLQTETFCVMQFEAKDNGSGTPESVAAGNPWVSINANDAQAECETVTEGGYTGTFSLISNPEWMTIARDIENHAPNWSSGIVGTGMIPRGHSDDLPSNSLPVSNTSDPYDGTGNNSGEGLGSGWEQKRVHELSNGSQIWDFAGNAWEITDWTPGDGVLSLGPTNESSNWRELSSAPAGDLELLDYKPSNDSYNSLNGFGMFFGGPGGVGIRGGNRNSGVNSGPFSLWLDFSATDTRSFMGFRCVYREQQVPTAKDFTPPNMTENIESIITLEYLDYNGDDATTCAVSGLTNVTESTLCSCSLGVCTVGVTGLTNYTGPASFSFSVTDDDGESNSANVSLSIDP